MNDKGVYRTAPATPGLLNIIGHKNLCLSFTKYFEWNSGHGQYRHLDQATNYSH